ncbi:hypothetical protein L0222_21780 [bacterium]|nr:hypothetical protein [bacterium]MCI0606677.1 hypothetical protein [bacterium]
MRSSLTLKQTGDLRKALAERNVDVSPHLSHVDLGGHGYAVVRAESDALEVEFVCIPRPLERTDRPDGGPLLYRMVHRVQLWNAGEIPRLKQSILEGSVPLSK